MPVRMWSWIFMVLYLVGVGYFTWRAYLKTKTLADFSTAARSYGWFIISMATVAAWCSAAAFLGQPGMGYGIGFPALWYVLGYAFSGLGWAISMFGMWRVGVRVNAKTPSDFLGKRFNSDLVKTVASLIVILNIYYVAGQFVGLGWLFETALGIPYIWGVYIAAGVTALYVVLGGSHSSLLNQAYQATIMVVGAIIVLFVAFFFAVPGGVHGVNEAIVAQNPALGWDNIFSTISPLFAPFPAISICIGLGLGAMSPQMCKNFFSIKNKNNLPKVAIAGFVLMFIMSFMMLGGIGARAALGDAFMKAPDRALPELLVQRLPAPVAAFIVIGMLAAIMSSAGALYLAISNAVIVDLYRDIIAPKLFKTVDPARLDKQALLMSRILIVIVTLAGVAIAIPPPPYLTALIWSGLGGISCAVSPSVILGAVWRRVNAKASATSMIASIIVYLYVLFGLHLHPYTALGIGCIVSFPLIIIVSLVTKPQSKEYLVKLFGY